MPERRIHVFFYGSYLNLKVLEEVELRPTRVAPAMVNGFELTIAPRANLLPRVGATAFGIVADASHAELQRLYTHASAVLGAQYLPEGVLVQRLRGGFEAASCYVSHAMTPGPIEPEYVDRILIPARGYGFPEWYLRHIESFKR
jgi:hypothetical protein